MEFKMNEHSFQSEFPFGTLKISSQDEFGFRPYTLLVSSVAVCSGGVLRKILEKMRIDFSDIRITADVVRNPEIANRIEKIALHFTIIGENISESKVEKAMALARKNCSMIQSVQDSIEVKETFEIKAS